MPEEALATLTDAINQSFIDGKFPSFLKLAIVVPLYKGGDDQDPASFRPIALLPTMSKIIEKIVKKRIISFIETHKIIDPVQFGFQNNLSTTDAIFSFLEGLYLKLNDNESAAAVFCDLSKAFDCVNHDVLLFKLQLYGFRGVSYNWFRSYLSDRRQKVTFKNKTSKEATVDTGVPQGSVLGPLLFLLYVNDLASIDISGKFTLFADDATILWCDKGGSALLNIKVNNDLVKIKEWCDLNYLSLNVKKTCIMSFKCELGPVSVDNCALADMQENKFLGMYIDAKLKFEAHIEILNGKLSSNCYALRIIRSKLGKSMARNAYYSLIEPHLRYGLCFWGICSKQLLQSIFVLQKRAVRSICRAKVQDSCKPLFIAEKILTLTSLFILETACLVKKKYEVVSNQTEYNTRLSHFIQLPLPNFTLTKNSIIFNGKKIFNHLPLGLRQRQCDKSFRRSLKELLIVRPYYDLEEFFDDSFT